MSSPLHPRGSGASNAFTLIELLTVIAIIGVLAGITFGVMKGVNERAAISQTRGELSSLQIALDNYKRQYGDYPQTKDADNLLQALIGRRGPTGASIDRKNLLELSKFTLSDPTKDPATDDSLTLVDPWGRSYKYFHKGGTSGSWRQASFILYSMGPDGADTEPDEDSGAYDAAASGNADNVFAEK